MRDRFPELSDLVSHHAAKEIISGRSGARVYYLPEMCAYLKIAPSSGSSNLLREKEALEWLEGKLPVPRVLAFEEHGDDRLLLVSEMAGTPASDYSSINQTGTGLIRKHIEIGARAMRRVHDLSIRNCPLDQGIEVKLETAMDNICRGFIDEDDFDEENLDRTANEIHAELVRKKPVNEDLVFAHGDFCPANYLIVDGEVSGFVDLERAGIADRYQDIALFLRSFAVNTENSIEANEVFCTAYGIETLDEEKLYYYRLLDELF